MASARAAKVYKGVLLPSGSCHAVSCHIVILVQVLKKLKEGEWTHFDLAASTSTSERDHPLVIHVT